MQYRNNGKMMSQMYVQLYDIPLAGYEGNDYRSIINDKALQDNRHMICDNASGRKKTGHMLFVRFIFPGNIRVVPQNYDI
jgi:hypothetical protein